MKSEKPLMKAEDKSSVSFGSPILSLNYWTWWTKRKSLLTLRWNCLILDAKQQQDFLEAMDASQNAPSLSQAIRIKKLAQQSEFSYDAVYDIMNEEKKSELDTVTIKNETLRKYFPRSYTPRQMESIIIKLLDQWQLKKQQQAKQKKQEEAR